MKPKKIFLVRHGQSTGNVDITAYRNNPDWKIELTDKGHAQAISVGNELKNIIGENPVAFYVSPYTRTKQTLAGILTNFKESDIYSVKEDPRIREQEYGTGKMKSDGDSFNILERERIECGPFFYRMPSGESPADMFDRMTTFLDTLHRDFKKEDFPENMVIVSHGMAIRVFLMRWFHWTVDHFHKVRNPENCCVIQMEKQENGKYKIVTELKMRD